MKTRQLLYLSVLVVGLLSLSSCSEDATDLTSVNEMLSDGRIAFSASPSSTAAETRAALSGYEPEAISLSGEGRQLWLLPSVQYDLDATTFSGNAATRGTQLGRSDKMTSFGVSAFLHNKAESNVDTDLTGISPEYFYNLEAAEIGESGVYQIEKNYYWPEAGKALTFQAYYPYGNDNVQLSDASETTKATGPQTFNVTVAQNAKEQVDFMTAEALNTVAHTQTANPSVPLGFRHHMTAVRFVLGDQFLSGYIKNIVISGVYVKGTYTVGKGWTLSDDDKSSVGISYNLDKHVDGKNGTEITAEGETFLMIPQTFGADTDTENAKIYVVYHDGDDDYEVEASLAGQAAWVEGTTVTYAISSTKLTTLRISDIDYATTVSGAPKTSWAEGDAVGMYVVGSDGVSLIHKNVKCTYVGGTTHWKWSIDHSNGTVYHLPGQHYYFYYPYVEDQPKGYPEISTSTGQAATSFFNGVISQYATVADQSETSKFVAADLQVSKGEDDAYSSTIKATMERQVGLARLQLPSKSIPTTVTYTNNASRTETGTTSVGASTAFEGNKLCPSGDIYYFFTKANTPTMFNVSTGDNAWSSSVNVTLAAAETDEVKTVYGKRYDWKAINYVYNYTCTKSVATFSAPEAGTYTLQVWGAQGGTYTTYGVSGKGGYATGTTSLTANQPLYVCVGEYVSSGVDIGGTAAYNGGGVGSAPGGGATHIAKLNNRGVLSGYASNRGEILIVAGGGGGGDDAIGGNGGGTSGETGKPGVNGQKFISIYPTGGTQDTGGRAGVSNTGNTSDGKPGSFGQGGAGGGADVNNGGGGGGGYFGGGGISFGGPGGGGSSYIGGVDGGSTTPGSQSFTSPQGTTETGHSGSGYARISLKR